MSDEHEQVYVLRLWDEEDPPHGHRISLYHAFSGQRLYFGSLEALHRHLCAQLDLATGPDDAPDAPHLKS